MYSAPSRIPAILRRDRRLLDPILQPLHRLIMSLRDFGFDVGEVVRLSRNSEPS